MARINDREVKMMVKKFNLTEGETDFLWDIVNGLNGERGEICEDIQIPLLYGTSFQEVRNAIQALLVYVGAKVQRQQEVFMSFDKTIFLIAEILKCGSYQVGQWIKGIAANKDRFGKYVECSTTFGLDYLEIV